MVKKMVRVVSVILIWLLVQPMLPWEEIARASAALSPAREAAQEEALDSWKQAYEVSDEDLQTILHQGYSLEEAKAAFQRKKETGADLIESLNQLSPQYVNRSQEVESTVIGEVYAPLETQHDFLMAPRNVVQEVHTRPEEAPYFIPSKYESVSSVSGELSLETTDMVISSRNGLSFPLTRTYGHNKSAIEGIQPLGVGWDWDIPYILDRYEQYYLYLKGELGSGAYKIESTGNDNYHLVGYPYGDLVIKRENNRFVVHTLAGTKYHFEPGINEYKRLEKITDMYNNTISFTYQDQGYAFGRAFPSMITSDTGESITIHNDALGIVLTKGDQKVRYAATIKDGVRFLSKVRDAEGRTTTYDYKIGQANRLNYYENNRYRPFGLLTGVTHPTGARSEYVYEETPVKRCRPAHQEEEYRLKEKYISMQAANGAIQKIQQHTYSYVGDSESCDNNSHFSVTVNNGLLQTQFHSERVIGNEEIPMVFFTSNMTQTATWNGVQQTVSTDYTYDRARRLTKPTQEQVTYSSQGQTRVYTSSRQYDAHGNVMWSIDPMNVKTEYGYHPQTHLLTSIKQPVSNTQTRYTVFTRNAQRKIEVEQVFDGSPTGTLLLEKRYELIDAYGNPRRIQTKQGNAKSTVTDIEYSDLYRNKFPTKTTTQVTAVDGTISQVVQEYEYDTHTGNITKSKDSLQNATTYQYDRLGRLLQANQPDGSAIIIQYNDMDNSLLIVDETGGQTYTKWNPAGLKEMTGINERLITSKYRYDAYGRLSRSEDARGNATTFEYDSWNRLYKTTYPDLSSSTVEYDDILLTKKTTDQEGYIITVTSDKLGRPVETKETKKVIVNNLPTLQTQILSSLLYDNEGRVLEATDARGYKTLYTYDVLDRLKSVTNAKQETTRYDYSPAADLFPQMKMIYPDGKERVKKMDELGRPILLITPGDQRETYRYEGNGNRTSYVNRNGDTFRQTFTNRNWLEKQEVLNSSGQPIEGETISYQYDQSGRRLTMNDATGQTLYTYDQLTGRLAKVTYPDGKTIQYNYDETGKLMDYKDPFDMNVYYKYDSRDRLQAVAPTTTGSPYAQYSYWKNNKLKQISQANGVISDFTYEGLQLSTLIQKKSGGQVLGSYAYGYDTGGNQTSIATNREQATFTYDELNRISTSKSKESEGLLLSDATYTYDKRDRLTSVTRDGQTTTYRYNGDGLLWERASQGEASRYYYNGDQVIAEGSLVQGQAEWKARYIRGLGLVAMDDGQALSYYLHNGHGDVTELRDSTGQTRLNEYTYDIWGNPLNVKESVPNPFRYSGELWDSVSKLQYLRARWYDPSIHRFINEDTYEGDINNPLSLNLYTYVHNNPLTNIDPTGHWCTSADGKWSGPGGCNGGIEGQEDVNRDVGTSKWNDDKYYFGQPIYENGEYKGKYYPEGSFRIESDPTGITDAFIGCAYDDQCSGFVGAAIVEGIPAAYNGAKSGAQKGWNWAKGLKAKYIGKNVEIDKIKPNSYDEFSNPNIGPSQQALSKHKRTISETGKIEEPILVKDLGNGTYEIINGHHRWEAARQMGLKKIPVKVIE
ncbi:RHS repeat-associated core domain-containing protein [Paenibacillus sp. UNCCL117]|uniref:RHS repeat-associated core domain-containing protein n=1 Tax=unclassified Paenibacillus TaxID=185978 RepID=UPI0008901C27|nr:MULTISPECIES: RHS repeat-associated core domain-containing protein [unclassified Paenibacillus]SDE19925.1 RHS repeat-associated core domain-containing protein [Paenibacillus sp. cl123]SFW61905.1 RHS repeat-associated core domain-containing protein [Paenibacillus sp. UNCCL117]